MQIRHINRNPKIDYTGCPTCDHVGESKRSREAMALAAAEAEMEMHDRIPNNYPYDDAIDTREMGMR